MKRIGFIGTGNLSQSIVRGLQESGHSYSIFLYDVMSVKAMDLAKKYKAESLSFPDLLVQADTIIIAVKPKDVVALLKDMAQRTLDNKLIISTAAGIGLSYYEEKLPGISIVRVMPNTSSAVLRSVTGMVRGKNVTDQQAETAAQIFHALGKVIWVDDHKMNAVTAVSGSGPAYFYLLTELMSRAGVELGLDQDEAEFLARETLIGAGQMLEEDDRSPRTLREAVTSPNGTTYAALETFRSEQFDQLVRKAMEACARRAGEMEGEYSGE